MSRRKDKQGRPGHKRVGVLRPPGKRHAVLQAERAYLPFKLLAQRTFAQNYQPAGARSRHTAESLDQSPEIFLRHQPAGAKHHGRAAFVEPLVGRFCFRPPRNIGGKGGVVDWSDLLRRYEKRLRDVIGNAARDRNDMRGFRKEHLPSLRMPGALFGNIAHYGHDWRKILRLRKTPGKESWIFGRCEIGEEDIWPFKFDVIGKTKRTVERDTAQQNRRACRKVVQYSGNQTNQTCRRDAFGSPNRTGRYVRFRAPRPLSTSAKENEPRRFRHFVRVGNARGEQHNVHRMPSLRQPAGDFEHRPLCAATGEAWNQECNMCQDSASSWAFANIARYT